MNKVMYKNWLNYNRRKVYSSFGKMQDLYTNFKHNDYKFSVVGNIRVLTSSKQQLTINRMKRKRKYKTNLPL